LIHTDPGPFTSPIQTTFYFRTHINYSPDTNGTNVQLTHIIDDGCVIYVNGLEAYRYNLPAPPNPIFYSTFTLQTISLASQIGPISFSATNLVAGDNVIAVEVHQASTISSDIGMAIALTEARHVTNVVSFSVALNEVMANNRTVTNSDGTITDWAEIYNPSPNTVDLSDMSLTDDLTKSRRWIFPSGASIASLGYLVVKFDNANPPSLINAPLLNTGFGLDANGGNIFLFNSRGRGGALLSSITFGPQPQDFSIGRLAGGASASAGPWALTVPTPGAVNVAAPLGDPSTLKINEWMANPNRGDEDWFELYNPDPQPVSIGGLYLTDDLTFRDQYRIPALSFINGAGINGFVQFHTEGNPAKGATHTNFKLADGGGSIGLFDGKQSLIDGIAFGPQAQGVSEGRFPDGSSNVVTFPGSETPGASNLRLLTEIVINEVLTHANPPFEDAIELYNQSNASIDVSGWYLSDHKSDPFRFRIPQGTLIESHGFAVFYESQFSPSLALSSAHGNNLYLFSTDLQENLTGYRTSAEFGAAESGFSFGRYNTSQKTEFTALSQRTFGVDSPGTAAEFRTSNGLPNAYPKVGPIVISEIQYHPPGVPSGSDNALDEFIELQNIATTNVLLYHGEFPTNKWRLLNAIEFIFPEGFFLPPGGFVLVVNFDPIAHPAQLTEFKNKYSVPDGVPVIGPYLGKLDNSGARIELVKPDAPQPPGPPDGGFVPYVLVDKIEYTDSGSWPSLADGIGNSIQRRVPSDYGNDPVNWFAGAATAGASNGVAAATAPVIQSLTPSHLVGIGVTEILTVTATGADVLKYQWYFNASPIERATNNSLTISNVQPKDAGIYSVLVWNSAGAASSSLQLDVKTGPLILQQPQSHVAAFGGTTFFTVGVRGSVPLTYLWFKNTTPITGATNPVLQLVNLQPSDEANYHVVVTNLYGQASSDPAGLSLSAAPTFIVMPQSTNVFVGATVIFSPIVNGTPPLHYQWRFNNANIPGATNATLTLNNVQLTSSGNYTLRVTNFVDSAISTPATLAVSIAPVVSVRATDPTASESGSDTGTFTVTRVNGLSLPLTVAFSLSGTATAGADYVSLDSPITFAPGSASTNIIVKVFDDFIREPAETVILTLVSQPTAYVIGSPASATVTIADDDNLPPSVTVTNPIAGSIFNAGDNISLGASASDQDGSVAKVEFFYDTLNKVAQFLCSPFAGVWSNAPAGTRFITAIATDNLGRQNSSAPVPVIINAFPVVNISTPADNSILFAPASFTIAANAIDADGNVAVVDFFAGTNLLGSAFADPFSITLSNLDVGDFSLTARATDNRGAVRVSAPVTISVIQPKPNFDDMFALRGIVTGLTNSIAGTNTTYTREPGEPLHDGVPGSHSGWLSWTAPASGICAMDTFGSTFDTVLAVYTNKPPSIQAVTNLLRVVSNDDADDSTLLSRVSFQAIAGVTYQIAVDGYDLGPEPSGSINFHVNLLSISPAIVSQPQSQVVNAGSVATFVVGAAGPSPLAYQWFFNGGLLNGATNAFLAVTNVSGGDQGLYRAVISNNSGSATSSSAGLTIRQAPALIGQLQSQVVSPGSNVTFSVAASGTPPFTYQWAFEDVDIVGATTGTLIKGNVQHTNGGLYSVRIGNPAGQAVAEAELFVRPTWIPLPLLSNNVVRLLLDGTPGKRYSIDATTNFTDWVPVGSLTNNGGQATFDPNPTGTNRIYRARQIVP